MEGRRAERMATMAGVPGANGRPCKSLISVIGEITLSAGRGLVRWILTIDVGRIIRQSTGLLQRKQAWRKRSQRRCWKLRYISPCVAPWSSLCRNTFPFARGKTSLDTNVETVSPSTRVQVVLGHVHWISYSVQVA